MPTSQCTDPIRLQKPLRELNAAPLPGQALAVLDADRRLVCDVIPCEDAYAQERTLLGEVLQTVSQDDLWIADRNFCTVSFLSGIAQRKARFIIRRHAQMPLETEGRKRRVGRTERGTVYEQTGYARNQAQTVRVRVITIKLTEETRDGESEIVLVTNLPQRVSARRVAKLYRGRWTIETAFQQVATALRGEIDSLAYPKAALSGFCIALVAHNLLNMIKAAIATAQGGDRDALSNFYLADEIRSTYRGMMIVLPPEYWQTHYGDLEAARMANELLDLASQVEWSRVKKYQANPRNPPADLGAKTNRNHVSTKRVLDEYHASSC